MDHTKLPWDARDRLEKTRHRFFFQRILKMGEETKRQTFLALAKLAEQAERYEGEPPSTPYTPPGSLRRFRRALRGRRVDCRMRY